MTDGTTLLPCPFCGGEAHTYKNNLWHVACERAHNGCVTMSAFVTEAEAIEAWNSRAKPPCGGGYCPLCGAIERTCKQEERGWGTEGDHARVWLTCGHDCMVPTVQDLPNYCPICGARRVGE